MQVFHLSEGYILQLLPWKKLDKSGFKKNNLYRNKAINLFQRKDVYLGIHIADFSSGSLSGYQWLIDKLPYFSGKAIGLFFCLGGQQ